MILLLNLGAIQPVGRYPTRRTWQVDLKSGEVRPWGPADIEHAFLATDEEGFVYAASPVTGQLSKLTPRGDVIWQQEIPVSTREDRNGYPYSAGRDVILIQEIAVMQNKVLVNCGWGQDLFCFDTSGQYLGPFTTAFRGVFSKGRLTFVGDKVVELSREELSVFDSDGKRIHCHPVKTIFYDEATTRFEERRFKGIAFDAEAHQILIGLDRTIQLHQRYEHHFEIFAYPLDGGPVGVVDIYPLISEGTVLSVYALGFDTKTGDLLVSYHAFSHSHPGFDNGVVFLSREDRQRLMRPLLQSNLPPLLLS